MVISVIRVFEQKSSQRRSMSDANVCQNYNGDFINEQNTNVEGKNTYSYYQKVNKLVQFYKV